MTLATAVCVFCTLAALLYVFYLPGKLSLGAEKNRIAYLHERKAMVYENLRDLNFEYKAGKLADVDYYPLKSSLEAEAGAVLAEIAQIEQGATEIQASKPKGVKP